jgi:hypothetical protein
LYHQKAAGLLRPDGSMLSCGIEERSDVLHTGTNHAAFRHARPRNLIGCHSGALGNGAGAASLLAATDRANASGQRALIAKLGSPQANSSALDGVNFR